MANLSYKTIDKESRYSSKYGSVLLDMVNMLHGSWLMTTGMEGAG